MGFDMIWVQGMLRPFLKVPGGILQPPALGQHVPEFEAQMGNMSVKTMGFLTPQKKW